VAAAALFLTSDDAAWITGGTLLLDGGGHTRRYPELARYFASRPTADGGCQLTANPVIFNERSISNVWDPDFRARVCVPPG
jgi:hypothetical protein